MYSKLKEHAPVINLFLNLITVVALGYAGYKTYELVGEVKKTKKQITGGATNLIKGIFG